MPTEHATGSTTTNSGNVMKDESPNFTSLWLGAALFFTVIFGAMSIDAGDPLDAIRFATSSVTQSSKVVDVAGDSAADLYEGDWTIQSSGDSIVFVHHD